MSIKTSIEWCDSSVNPVMGCDGCELWMPEKGVEHCYAGTLHKMRGGQKGYADQFDVPKLFPGRMAEAASWPDLSGTVRPDKPWLNGYPRMIFVSDMGDAFSKSVPLEYLRDEVIAAAESEKGKRHIWLWLTKQPHRMEQLADMNGYWPANIWALTSVTSAQQTARIKHLLRVPAAVRGLSLEPLLGPLPNLALTGIHWVIVGGESGLKARPLEPAWVTDIRDQCVRASVPFFFKQWGGKNKKKAGRLREGRTWDEMPSEPVGVAGSVGNSSRRVFLPVLSEPKQQATCRQGATPTKPKIKRQENKPMKKAPQKAAKKATRKAIQKVARTEIERNKRAGRCAACDAWWDKGTAEAILLPSLATFFKAGLRCLDREACAVRAADLRKIREDISKMREQRKQAKNAAWQKKNAAVLAEFDKLVAAHDLHAAPEGVEMVRCGPGPLLIEAAEGGRSQAQVWVRQGSLGVIAIDWRDGEKRRLFAEKHLLSEDSILLRTTRTATTITSTFTLR